MKKLILILIVFVLFGCEKEGQEAIIIHHGRLVNTIHCIDRITLYSGVDTLIIKAQKPSSYFRGVYDDIMRYDYKNDNNYKVEITPCKLVR